MVQQNRVAKILGLVFVIIGVVFAAMGAVFFITLNNPGDEEMRIVSTVFAIIGAVFLIPGVIFLSYAAIKSNQRKKLMGDGIAYDAEITRVYQNMNYGGYYRRYPAVITVDCAYVGEDGKSYLVRAKNLWYGGFENPNELRAKVWVDRYDPKKYTVELYSKEFAVKQQAQYDVDLR